MWNCDEIDITMKQNMNGIILLSLLDKKKLGKGYFGIIAKKCLWHVFIRVSWSARRNKWTDHMQQGQQWTKKEDLKLER